MLFLFIVWELRYYELWKYTITQGVFMDMNLNTNYKLLDIYGNENSKKGMGCQRSFQRFNRLSIVQMFLPQSVFSIVAWKKKGWCQLFNINRAEKTCDFFNARAQLTINISNKYLRTWRMFACTNSPISHKLLDINFKKYTTY